MIIIGGLGSVFGSFAGAALLVLLPVLLKNVLVGQLGWQTDLAAHLEIMIVGAMIIVFLIAEPHGMAQLWRRDEGETEALAVPALGTVPASSEPAGTCNKTKPWEEDEMRLKHLTLALALAGRDGAAAPAMADLVFPSLSYRTGPYGAERHSVRRRLCRTTSR